MPRTVVAADPGRGGNAPVATSGPRGPPPRPEEEAPAFRGPESKPVRYHPVVYAWRGRAWGDGRCRGKRSQRPAGAMARGTALAWPTVPPVAPFGPRSAGLPLPTHRGLWVRRPRAATQHAVQRGYARANLPRAVLRKRDWSCLLLISRVSAAWSVACGVLSEVGDPQVAADIDYAEFPDNPDYRHTLARCHSDMGGGTIGISLYTDTSRR